MQPSRALSIASLFLFITTTLNAQVSVTTWHNDNARTGLNANEVLLTPNNVNATYFSKLFSQQVDGPVYAQPLYVPNVAITNKGTHNVVFVVTQHDSVYAFDADNKTGINSTPLWRTSFINSAQGINPVSVSSGDVGPNCQTFFGEIGIVGTPAIDIASGTLFVVAHTKEPLQPPNNTTYILVQRLHALDITTGIEKGNPAVIDASVPGTGVGNSGGIIRFNPTREVQRSGLLLANGVLYIGWCSYCDNDPYHGWILAYDPHTLTQLAILNVTPNAMRGGIWMGGAGPAAAADGTVYCMTGNGTFDTNTTSPVDFGDSFLKLQLQGTNLTVRDYFTPYNQGYYDTIDHDIGSGGAMLVPDSAGSLAHPHLVVGAGKDGIAYLLDRDNLGHFNPADNSQIVQQVSIGGTMFGMPAFYNNRLYFQTAGTYLRAFAIANAQINPTPLSQSPETDSSSRGSNPSISANGATNGIVWQLEAAPALGISTLRAYNAENLAQKLYDSYNSLPPTLPDQLTFVKFVTPTIANGKVYVGGTNSVGVFGLKEPSLSITRDRATGYVQLTWHSPPDITNIVQVSMDLVTWTDLGPGGPTGNGNFQFVDSTGAAHVSRFFRLR